MNCNFCGNKLVTGFISLHSSHKARVSFTKNMIDKNFFWGSIFDSPKDDEMVILTSSKNKYTQQCLYCNNCRTFTIKTD